MTLLPPFETPLAAALNRLLEVEDWARERLASFAGETLAVHVPPLPALRLVIASDGRLARDAGLDEPSLILTLGPEFFAALGLDEDHVLRAVQVKGGASLANEVLFLARHLRWDVEEDLSKLVGDVAARRLAGAARELFAWQADTVRRIVGGAVEYARDTGGLLATREALAAWAQQIGALREGIARLEARLARLG